MRRYLIRNIFTVASALINPTFTDTHQLSIAPTTISPVHFPSRASMSHTTVMHCSSSTAADVQEGVTAERLLALASAIKHALSDCPKAGVRVSDLHKRMVKVFGAEAVDYKALGFATMFEGLVLACDSLYVVKGKADTFSEDGDIDSGSINDDDWVVIPCIWAEVLQRVCKKLPIEGVLEPALHRYIAAEDCPRFKSASQSLPLGSEGKMMYPSIKEWLIDMQFNTIISPVDVPSHQLIGQDGEVKGSRTTIVYKPVENISHNVMLLRNALRTLGCTSTASMPVSVNLRDIASVLHPLPEVQEGTDNKSNITSRRYTWPEFLQLQEIKKHFTVEVDVLVQTKRVSSDTTVVLIDGTCVDPDEGEAAIHRWVASERIRRGVTSPGDHSDENTNDIDSSDDNIPKIRRTSIPSSTVVKTEVYVVRYDTNSEHISSDIVMFDDVLDPHHAMAAKLASIALGTPITSSPTSKNGQVSGNAQEKPSYKSKPFSSAVEDTKSADEAAAIAMANSVDHQLTSVTLETHERRCPGDTPQANDRDIAGLGSDKVTAASALGVGFSSTVVVVCRDNQSRERLRRGLEPFTQELGGGGVLRFEYIMVDNEE
eukprot:Tbor_TRINITY_DN5611_c0_g5::TRINITY_DN5611_c0_g5_i1::g.9084::m.9084